LLWLLSSRWLLSSSSLKIYFYGWFRSSLSRPGTPLISMGPLALNK
jgi:hypothetical protein